MNPSTIALTDLRVGMKVTVFRPDYDLLITGNIKALEFERNYKGEITTGIQFTGWGFSKVEISQEELVAVFPPEEE